MFEDGIAFSAQLFGAHGHTHFDVFDFPFGPSATVHPHTTVVEPLLASLQLFVNGGENGVGTLLVRAMWVGQVACNVYLVRLNAVDKLANHLYIGLAHRQFLYLTRLVERQVEEVNTLQGDVVIR